ncbi:MAG: alpha-mannosidase, partial [Clostridia bacterium]|nr:alpha-mannosidase [Clostridia bacterium]
VKFDENGYISSLYDIRVNREVKRDGGASLGTLWLAEDMPTAYDNWEIEDDIFLKMQPVTELVSSEVVSDGAVEYRIRNTYKIGRATTAVVDTVFYAGDPRIDYQMKIDWNERRHLLKAGFDVNIRAMTVKNEIQFGHVERPTTRNTSLEAAKFEVCNHKWSDISENRYGVAVLNDCKYGISVDGSDMRLTLHKGGCRPDTTGDRGVHYMTYSLLPHVGAFSAETVVQPAYILNTPVVKADGILNAPKLFSVSEPNVICEAVKNAEDIENAYVIRLYECERNLTNCKIAFSGAKNVWRTNMLEEKQEELTLDNGTVSLTVKPFEIVTLLVER